MFDAKFGWTFWPFCFETPHFHVWCPRIVPNCSCELRTPRPATGVSRPFRARSVPGSVPESVPENGCVHRVSPGPGFRNPKSVPRVSPECQKVRDVWGSTPKWPKIGKKLKGSLPKGSAGKRVRIDLPVPLPVPTPPPPPPFPFPSFATGKPPSATPLNPTPNPSPRDTNGNSHPFAKTTPGKNYPLVSAL